MTLTEILEIVTAIIAAVGGACSFLYASITWVIMLSTVIEHVVNCSIIIILLETK